jgi:translation initiation factor 3 subunit M
MNVLSELDQTQLERKIRLLSFASLGFAHIGHDLPYSEVASTLQIELNQVEKWAIDGVSPRYPAA